jgi:hypothetical protein
LTHYPCSPSYIGALSLPDILCVVTRLITLPPHYRPPSVTVPQIFTAHTHRLQDLHHRWRRTACRSLCPKRAQHQVRGSEGLLQAACVAPSCPSSAPTRARLVVVEQGSRLRTHRVTPKAASRCAHANAIRLHCAIRLRATDDDRRSDHRRRALCSRRMTFTRRALPRVGSRGVGTVAHYRQHPSAAAHYSPKKHSAMVRPASRTSARRLACSRRRACELPHSLLCFSQAMHTRTISAPCPRARSLTLASRRRRVMPLRRDQCSPWHAARASSRPNTPKRGRQNTVPGA